jgi:hypothetical protein
MKSILKNKISYPATKELKELNRHKFDLKAKENLHKNKGLIAENSRLPILIQEISKLRPIFEVLCPTNLTASKKNAELKIDPEQPSEFPYNKPSMNAVMKTLISTLEEYNIAHLKAICATLKTPEKSVAEFASLVDLLKIRDCFRLFVLPFIDPYIQSISEALYERDRARDEVHYAHPDFHFLAAHDLNETIQVIDQLAISLQHLLEPQKRLCTEKLQKFHRIEACLTLSQKDEEVSALACSTIKVLQKQMRAFTVPHVSTKLKIGEVTDVDGHAVPMAKNKEDVKDNAMTHWTVRKPWNHLIYAFNQNISKQFVDPKDLLFFEQQMYLSRKHFFLGSILEKLDDAVAELTPTILSLAKTIKIIPEEFDDNTTKVAEEKIGQICREFKELVDLEFKMPPLEECIHDCHRDLWLGKAKLFTNLSVKLADCLQRALTAVSPIEKKSVGAVSILCEIQNKNRKANNLEILEKKLQENIKDVKQSAPERLSEVNANQLFSSLAKIINTLKFYMFRQNNINQKNQTRARAFEELNPVFLHLLQYTKDSMEAINLSSFPTVNDLIGIMKRLKLLSEIVEMCYSKRLQKPVQKKIVEFFNEIRTLEETAAIITDKIARLTAADVFTDSIKDETLLEVGSPIENAMRFSIDKCILLSMRTPGEVFITFDDFENLVFETLEHYLSVVTREGSLRLELAEEIKANVIECFENEKWSEWFQLNFPRVASVRKT